MSKMYTILLSIKCLQRMYTLKWTPLKVFRERANIVQTVVKLRMVQSGMTQPQHIWVLILPLMRCGKREWSDRRKWTHLNHNFPPMYVYLCVCVCSLLLSVSQPSYSVSLLARRAIKRFGQKLTGTLFQQSDSQPLSMMGRPWLISVFLLWMNLGSAGE